MKIVLVGKSGSGKDSIKKLLSLCFKPAVNYTTRPIRKGEINGIDYHFVSKEEFDSIDMIEKNCFRDWWYGLSKEEFKKSEIFIFTPSGLNLLSEKNKSKLIIFYLTAKADIILNRLIKRGDDLDEIRRRIESDRLDFNCFNLVLNPGCYDYRILTNNRRPPSITKEILNKALNHKQFFYRNNRSNKISCDPLIF